MSRFRNQFFLLAPIALGLLVAAPAQAAEVTRVNRSTWGASGVPSYVEMNIYVPDNVATNPPIVVASHSCSTPISGFFGSLQGIRAAADANGFIIILPEASGRNCWDVGTTQSLTHDGGGDTHAIAQMVDYTLATYDGDPNRVYAVGGSSGAMMTQALLAVYPDIFKAGAARAGVPAGCWADGYDPNNQWSGNCANGNTTKTAQQWGDQVRAMYPGYTGPRRRIQIFHGAADATISYTNFGEAIKQWTNVLGLSETPTSTDTITTSVATYDRQFWQNECGYTVFEAWSGRNGSHSMAYEADAILQFFGLDQAGGSDPEPPCPDEGGSDGSGGAFGVGGSSGSGGDNGNVGVGGGDGTSGTGGSDPGSAAGGGLSNEGSGGLSENTGSGGTSDGPSADTGSGSGSGGCAIGRTAAHPASATAVALGLLLLAFSRRKRSAVHSG